MFYMQKKKYYHVLENPNEETGQVNNVIAIFVALIMLFQAERPYFELEPQNSWPKSNHLYHVLEETSGYHVPTKVK